MFKGPLTLCLGRLISQSKIHYRIVVKVIYVTLFCCINFTYDLDYNLKYLNLYIRNLNRGVLNLLCYNNVWLLYIILFNI